jgi:hypothetical protein
VSFFQVIRFYSSSFVNLLFSSSQTSFGIGFAILTSGYFFAAKNCHLLLFFTTNSSPLSASTKSHFSSKIRSKISSFSDFIFQIHFTFGYSELAKNGPNLPVFTTIVHSTQSGQGFHSYLFFKASNSLFVSSGWSTKSHSG